MNWILGCAGALLTATSLPVKEMINYDAKVTRYTIDDAGWKGKGRLRIAVISDFHAGNEMWSGRALARLVRKEEVDLICIAGDFFKAGVSHRESMRFVEDVCTWRPVYYVSGNNDESVEQIDGLKHVMAHHYGVHVLDNRKLSVRVKNSWVDLFGVRDRAAYKGENEWMWHVQQILSAEKAPCDEAYRVVLCHRPEQTVLFDQLKKHLVLTGHPHGNQWRISKKGIFKRGKQHPYNMVLSSGLGSDSMLPRVNNRPELVIVDIHNPEKKAL